jgi:hypothetical protein
MAGYSYKYVRDKLPPYLTYENEDYEGSADYDGDLWVAACCYIDEIEQELSNQFAITKVMNNEKLLDWLKTRPETIYNHGPAIID